MQPHWSSWSWLLQRLKKLELYFLTHTWKELAHRQGCWFAKIQRGGELFRESAGLEEEGLAHTLGSCSTHHPQRGLQLFPVMVFLDFLKTQDLGN